MSISLRLYHCHRERQWRVKRENIPSAYGRQARALPPPTSWSSTLGSCPQFVRLCHRSRNYHKECFLQAYIHSLLSASGLKLLSTSGPKLFEFQGESQILQLVSLWILSDRAGSLWLVKRLSDSYVENSVVHSNICRTGTKHATRV